MPSQSASEVAARVQRRGKSTIDYLRRLDERGVSKRDLKWAFAGGLLRYATFVEGQLEDLFLGALHGRYVFADSNVVPVVNVSSRQTARRLVLGRRDYVDWLPYSQTRSRADVFFRSGRPFSELADRHVESFTTLLRIRNSLAHDSDHARRVFDEKVVRGRVLPRRETAPMGYLVGMHTGDQTRLEYHVAKTVNAFRELCR